MALPLDGFLITLYHPLMISNALANSQVAQHLILTQLTPVWKYTPCSKNTEVIGKRCLFLKYDRDSAKQELCLKNSLLCLATTHKSFEAGAQLSGFVWLYLYIVYLYICVFVYLYICVFVCLCICIFV